MTDISAISSSQNGGSANPTGGAATPGALSMNFDDFLDMINPLEHIPIVSSVYRGVTGESINPLARIAGDALYGGVFGLASAGVSALGALGDEIFTAANGGQSASSTVMAALFGKDSDQTTQYAVAAPAPAATLAPAAGGLSATPDAALTLAQAATPAPAPTRIAALQTPAQRTPILQMPDLPAPQLAASAPGSTADLSAVATAGLSKAPYGGVLDTGAVQNAMQNQALALSLMSGHDNLQNQHALRNSRFATAGATSVTAATQQSAALPLPGETPMLSGGPNPAAAAVASINPAQALAAKSASMTPAPGAMAPGGSLSQTLGMLQHANMPGASPDLKAIKGLDQYRRSAQSMPVTGAALDSMN